VAGAVIDHLDLWTGAITKKSTSGRGSNGKIELTGIKKLRELILELAVRGKLVEQDPSEEPAHLILERLDSTVKKSRGKPRASCGASQPSLPTGWGSFRVGDYLDFQYGKSLPAKQRDDSGSIEVYGSNGVVGFHTMALTEEPCIVVGRKGSAGALNKALGPSWTTDVAYYVQPRQGFDFEFTYLLLQSLHLDQLGKGIKPGVNRNEAYALSASLPPLEEQHRIVQKVDELMALCDRLEQQTSDQLDAHETLVDTLLGTLTQSENAAELAENWARLAAHFDTLFTTEQSIDKLKQTILQLAVMGRLVEQDAGDEPAIDLLTRVHTRKIELANQKRIKLPRELARLDVTQHSYPAPSHWAWASFQDIADEISTGPFGSMIHKHDYVEAGVPLINPSHMVGGRIKEDPSVSVPAIKAEELSSYKLATGDIVMARRGEVGRCAVVTDRENGWLCGTGSFVLRFHPAINRQFILLLFSTDTVRDYLTGNSVGTTMTNLNHGILKKMPVALPPVQEQHRIVQKVDELMALCDQLKERLNQASETRCQLAEAVVEGALN
jgi:type I restriction enzyme S subunit